MLKTKLLTTLLLGMMLLGAVTSPLTPLVMAEEDNNEPGDEDSNASGGNEGADDGDEGAEVDGGDGDSDTQSSDDETSSGNEDDSNYSDDDDEPEAPDDDQNPGSDDSNDDSNASDGTSSNDGDDDNSKDSDDEDDENDDEANNESEDDEDEETDGDDEVRFILTRNTTLPLDNPLEEGKVSVDAEDRDVKVEIDGARPDTTYILRLINSTGSIFQTFGNIITDDEGEGKGKFEDALAPGAYSSMIFQLVNASDMTEVHYNTSVVSFMVILDEEELKFVLTRNATLPPARNPLREGKVSVDVEDGDVEVEVEGARSNTTYTFRLINATGGVLVFGNLATDGEGEGEFEAKGALSLGAYSNMIFQLVNSTNPAEVHYNTGTVSFMIASEEEEEDDEMSVEESEEGTVIISPDNTIEFSGEEPKMSFKFKNDTAELSFEAYFATLVEFNDTNSNKRIDGGEVLLTLKLEDLPWEITTMTSSTEVTINYTYAADGYNIQLIMHVQNLTIGGGAADKVKVDVIINTWPWHDEGSLLALLSEVEAEFEFEEGPIELPMPEANATYILMGLEDLYVEFSWNTTIIKNGSSDEIVNAYYTEREIKLEEDSEGSEAQVEIKVYIIYPHFSTLEHDPTIGIVDNYVEVTMIREVIRAITAPVQILGTPLYIMTAVVVTMVAVALALLGRRELLPKGLPSSLSQK